MRIILDMDEVLCSWNEAFAQLLVDVTGKTFEREPGWPSCWEWPKAAGYTTEDLQKAWRALQEEPFWWYSLPPTPDAQRLLNDGRLIQLFDDHDVIVLTNRMPIAKYATQMWLNNYCQVSMPTVLHVEGPKGPVINALSADLALDDHPRNLTSALPGIGCRLILIDQPYNQHEDAPQLERSTLYDVVTELYPEPSSIPQEILYEFE